MILHSTLCDLSPPFTFLKLPFSNSHLFALICDPLGWIRAVGVTMGLRLSVRGCWSTQLSAPQLRTVSCCCQSCSLLLEFIVLSSSARQRGVPWAPPQFLVSNLVKHVFLWVQIITKLSKSLVFLHSLPLINSIITICKVTCAQVSSRWKNMLRVMCRRATYWI